VLAVFNSKAHILARSAVGFEFVGDHDARRFCRLPQKFAHEPSRVGSISSALNQDVENEAVLIDGAPEPMLVATDCDDDFVETPFIATNRGASTNAIGEFSAAARGVRPKWLSSAGRFIKSRTFSYNDDQRLASLVAS
jgi:hypothetical protein